MKLNSIQFLRAIAALLVVYDHSMFLQLRYATSWQQNFLHLNKFGCIGVDMFFVISGFIIMFVGNKYVGKSQSIYFLAKRFFRINPVYYLLTLLFGIFIILKSDNQLFPFPIKNIGISLIDSFFIVPTSGDINYYNPLMVVGWTLSFEWLFYLLFFFLILLKVRYKTFFLIGAIVLLAVIGRTFQPYDFRLIFITNPILLEFLLGCLICNVYLTFKRIPAFIGICCLVIGLAGYTYTIVYGFGNIWNYRSVLSGYLSLERFLLWGIPSSLIIAGCVILEKNKRFTGLWNNQFVLLNGDASYSIYLVHAIVLNLLMLLYKKTGYFLPADLMIWLQIIIAIAVSIFFYKLVEKPILKLIYKNFLRHIKIMLDDTKEGVPEKKLELI